MVAYGEWVPDSVMDRRKRLVEWALQRWQVEPAPLTDVTPEEDEDVQETPAVKTGLLAPNALDYESESERSTGRRGAGAWTWDEYYKHTRHAPAKIDRVKDLAERIKEFAPQPPTTSINQIVFRVGNAPS